MTFLKTCRTTLPCKSSTTQFANVRVFSSVNSHKIYQCTVVLLQHKSTTQTLKPITAKIADVMIFDSMNEDNHTQNTFIYKFIAV